MATNYGQPPHFDLSKPFFSLARIEYSSSTGTCKKKLAIRRYTYNFINNNFVFNKAYKGVRQNPNRIKSVVDAGDVNTRDTLHAIEVAESSPSFATQTFLNSLFNFPNSFGLFFIEGLIKKYHSPPGRDGKPLTTRPDWFYLYRYGKIINNEIIILKESEDQITRSTI
jgi:hypothetical protein